MSTLNQSRVTFSTVLVIGLFVIGGLNVFLQRNTLIHNVEEARTLFESDGPLEAFKSLRGALERNAVGKDMLWDFYAEMQHHLQKREVNNFSVIKADDGRLYRGGLFPFQMTHAQELAKRIDKFTQNAQAKGAKVLYLNTPDSLSRGILNVPKDLPCRDYNAASDALLFRLREKGVPYLDARTSPRAGKLQPEEVSPATGYLLNASAAFTIFVDLVDELERRFSVSLDPDKFYRNLSNYKLTLIPDFFIGELGKETGPAFSGLDDFTTITPDFETRFSIESVDMFTKFSDAEGSAQSTLLNQDSLKYYHSFYDLYPQGYYVHTNSAWTTVKNRLNPEAPKLLVIHDFYPAQIIGLLAPLFGEMHTLAYQPDFAVNAEQYMESNSFDYIIISFSPTNLLRPETQGLIREAGKEDEEQEEEQPEE